MVWVEVKGRGGDTSLVINEAMRENFLSLNVFLWNWSLHALGVLGIMDYFHSWCVPGQQLTRRRDISGYDNSRVAKLLVGENNAIDSAEKAVNNVMSESPVGDFKEKAVMEAVGGWC